MKKQIVGVVFCRGCGLNWIDVLEDIPTKCPGCGSYQYSQIRMERGKAMDKSKRQELVERKRLTINLSQNLNIALAKALSAVRQ